MQRYNNIWEINQYKYYEVAQPICIIDKFLYLLKNNIKYKFPIDFIVLHVPTNKFFIQKNKINKFLEKISNDNI